MRQLSALQPTPACFYGALCTMKFYYDIGETYACIRGHILLLARKNHLTTIIVSYERHIMEQCYVLHGYLPCLTPKMLN